MNSWIHYKKMANEEKIEVKPKTKSGFKYHDISCTCQDCQEAYSVVEQKEPIAISDLIY